MVKVHLIREGGERFMVEEKRFPIRREAIAFIDGLKKDTAKVERTADGGYRVTLR
jgi:hypothetical protein